ncbi:MAG: flagellar biosynthesis anti-sigma factor FlgM [Pseudomonadota bacterium]
MANEINTNNPSLYLKSSTQNTAGKTQGSGENNRGGVGSANQGDKVSVTSEASRLKQIEEQLSNVPEVNSAKVSEIRKAIADGTFKIDPQVIAAKLIAFETGNR